MTHWVISCHGGAPVKERGPTAYLPATELVPIRGDAAAKTITFMQFGSEAEPLGSEPGWRAYHALMHSPPDFDAARKMPECKEFKGQSLPNYKMWGDDSWVDVTQNRLASGIFVAGDTQHQDPRTLHFAHSTPEQSPMALKDLLAWIEVQSGDVFWWLACRSWMRAGHSVPFPSQPVPQPNLPPHLRAPPKRQ